MRKHPVDDLFQKRLTSLEKKPSELAWKRIQEGQKKKSRRIVAWVWYAAASVVLTLVTSYLVWQGQNDISSPMHAGSEIAKVEKSTSKQAEVADSIQTESGSLSNDEAKSSLPSEQPTLAKREIVKESPSIKAKAERQAEINSANQPAPVQIAKIEPVKAEEVKIENAEIQRSISTEKVIPKTVELAQRDEKKPDRTIIVEVEEPESEGKDKSKSRLSRVFRQLKNVREAEPVDWEDVGFNPKSIIARADDRTNDDGKVSGKRERKN
ncbi:hypothetical protein L0657_15430 [Dyadobacter sp. CY345]|uniref:hypothetical protein n=1 Tax=Dyadobacter sp. CY345 TaxID=2909335 RepID=UPI001F395D77|nr:hypothetical protein [Dyadobacter sp. CY345]MCF2445360.1 hypothetical protein [Dyadobacter sp. CY345]